jgi:glycosylphosphatidylinositol transamidase (GPIT) subunit GPI8
MISIWWILFVLTIGSGELGAVSNSHHSNAAVSASVTPAITQTYPAVEY